MSDTETHTTAQPSSELVRWLQSLALPVWARGILVVVFLAIMLGGLSIAVWGAALRDKDAMTTAIGLLTVALPVSLVVIGLVFGQRSEKRLAQLTDAVLDTLITAQVERIACRPIGLRCRQHSKAGCRATYLIDAATAGPALRQPLKFSVELNVRKVNLMFSLPAHLRLEGPVQKHGALLRSYRHVLAGAAAEGYRLNDELACPGGEEEGTALVFFRSLPEDFLLRPIEKLYFAQDLGFFVKGMIDAQEAASKASDGAERGTAA